MLLSGMSEFMSGSPQFRIAESSDETAPAYVFYEQADLDDDLAQVVSARETRRQVRTFDSVRVVNESDIVFSLISGQASIVGRVHDGYLLTQNYVKIVPSAAINPRYLVYLLNEGSHIRRQLRLGLQGSQVLKYTIKQLNTLNLPTLPQIEKQELVGNLYFDQLHLSALQHRVAENMTSLVFAAMRRAVEQ